jgi:hypothetical protein
MKTIIRLTMITVLLAATQLSFAQYFSHLHDVDSLYNTGWSVISKPDNTYLVLGSSQNKKYGLYSSFNMNISTNGNIVLTKNVMIADSCTFTTGDQGQVLATADGGFMGPFVKQWPNPVTGYYYSAAGMVKYNSAGDTVFTRTYTDTSAFFDLMFACAVMPNGDYLIGGVHARNVPFTSPAYIIRVNSAGDTIWTHTYQKIPTEVAKINTLSALPNGHILVGAMSTHQENPDYVYDCRAPWFIELDGMGNIINDTLYSKGYVYKGAIYPDKLGGYVHIGAFDSLKTKFPFELDNFPNYIAHLDTNFRLEWITEFVVDEHYGHRFSGQVIQLQGGNFIVSGGFVGSPREEEGWAAKVDRSGKILWSHTYTPDSAYMSYFNDVKEKPNGDLVFVGAGFGDTVASWHNGRDVWILGTDSNGCVISGGCDPDVPWQVATPPSPIVTAGIKISPNPATGAFILSAPGKGTLQVCNMQGQLVATYVVKTGNTELRLPASVSAGMYVYRYMPEDGSAPQGIVRLVYEP